MPNFISINIRAIIVLIIIILLTFTHFDIIDFILQLFPVLFKANIILPLTLVVSKYENIKIAIHKLKRE